jgi:cytoskeleton protein RodZ
MPTKPLIEAVAEANRSEDAISVLTAGDILRQARKRLGLNEKEVADQLHITMHYVRALESNSYEKLPGAVFARGYVKSYALLLDLNVEELLSLYDELTHQQETDSEEEKRSLKARKKKDRNKPLVIMSLIFFVVGFLGLWLLNSYFTKDSVLDVPNTIDGVDNIQSGLPRVTDQQATTRGQLTQQVEPEEISALTRQLTIISSPVTGVVDAPDRLFRLDSGSILDSEVAQRIEGSENNGAEVGAVLENLTAARQVLRSQQAEGSEPTVDNDQLRLISIEAGGNDILRISFTGESWVEVNDSESQQIYRDIRSAGDVLEITGSAPYNILLGNALFTLMSLNGDEIDLSAEIRIDKSARLTVGL